MSLDKDTLIKLANECGIWIPMGSDKDAEVAKLQALTQAAYKLGLEDAAKVAESYIAPAIGKEIAAGIRKLGEQHE